MAVRELLDRLRDAGVEFELLAHPHTETAAAEAKALGLPSEEVAKTLVVRTPTGYVRVLVPARERLDLHKLRAGIETDKAVLATEQELERDYAEFELGAVPPLGGRPDPVLVDPRLVEREWVAFEAGTHDESVRVRSADLVTLANARVLDLCQD